MIARGLAGMRAEPAPAAGLARTLAALDLTAPAPLPRRRVLTRRLLVVAAACAALAVGLSLVFVTAGAPPADGLWTMFQGGPQRAGVGGGSGATGALLWEFQTGKDPKGFFGVECPPVIGRDGTIYVGAWDRKVYALEGKTGREKWEFGTGGAVRSSPAVGEDGTVYVGSQEGMKVYALDGAAGALKWDFAVDGGVYGSPVIGRDGTVYVGAGCTVYALDGSTGELIWENPLPGPMSTGCVTAPALSVDGLVVYAGIGSNNRAYGVYALDAMTGERKWWFRTDDHVVSSPSVGPDGTVYFGCDNHRLYAVDGSTGEGKWEFTTGGMVRSSAAISRDGTVYVGGWDKLYALDAQTGKEKGAFAMVTVTTSPVIGSDGTVYIAADRLYALDPTLGRKLWETWVDGDSFKSSPTIGPDGTVYVGTHQGKVVAVR